MAFVELHARSAFSFLRGSSSPEELITRAGDLGMEQMAVCDRDGFYGTARVHYKAKELGMRGLVGTELTMEDKTVIPVLVKTRGGYQNLCRLLTKAKLRAAKNESQIGWNELPAYAEGLIALTGDEEGPVIQALKDPLAVMAAPDAVKKLIRIFGQDNVAVELQRHRLRQDKRRCAMLMELAEQHQLPMIASNGPCYARRAGRLLLDAFTSLRHHTTLDEAGLLLAPNSQRYLKREKEMRELFADVPEAIDNTARIAERLEYTLKDLGYRFPDYPVPAGHNMDSFLRDRTYEGANRRYDKVDEPVRTQIEHELRLINKLGFSGYFLVVWDIVEYCKREGILVQGRGSAANSVVCYSLGITNAEPIRGKLLFERFLSEGRNTWPDIDLDLPSGERRERVIQEVYRRFAPHGAAMTANVITYRGRSAMREMGKVLGLPQDFVSRFSSLIGHGDYKDTMELNEHLQKAGVPANHPRLPALIKLYQAAYGLPRHLGQHSGGMVLCTQGLDTIVPLEPASMPGRVVVQWDKDDCEDLGIIKVDLLGLGMMAVIEDTLMMCKARGEDRAVELHLIPKDDRETFRMIQRGDTIGVFQIESRAQMATLPRIKPEEFYDIVVSVAIIRPGPIVGKMVHPYIERRRGREAPHCIDPMFADVLERTLGVPLFQEQMLKMAMIAGDFNGSDAEELRRALSYHRSKERMDKAVVKLRAAMTRKSVKIEVQEKIISAIQSFAMYGFPESHAISFALLAYASAWLRVHRLAEMTAALLNNQPMGFYSPATLVQDAKAHGLRILPVCIGQSQVECHVIDDSTIRLGLNQLRGVSRASCHIIIEQRDRAAFSSLEDFMLRCPLPKDERRVLAKAGALNALADHRRAALWQVEKHVEHDLFSLAAQNNAATNRKVMSTTPLLPMTATERLSADFTATSLTVGAHPMKLIRESLRGIYRAADLILGRPGQWVCIAGMIICRQRPGTANGHVFVSLEDETGISNVFVPSTLFEKNRLLITQESFLKIKGQLQLVDGVVSVYALKVEALQYNSDVYAKSHDFK